jgi:hypothetical protein
MGAIIHGLMTPILPLKLQKPEGNKNKQPVRSVKSRVMRSAPEEG